MPAVKRSKMINSDTFKHDVVAIKMDAFDYVETLTYLSINNFANSYKCTAIPIKLTDLHLSD